MSLLHKLVARKVEQFIREDAQLLAWAIDKNIPMKLRIFRDAFNFPRLAGEIEGQRRISFRIEEDEAGIVDFCIRHADHPKARERFKKFAEKYRHSAN